MEDQNDSIPSETLDPGFDALIMMEVDLEFIESHRDDEVLESADTLTWSVDALPKSEVLAWG